MPAWIRVIVLVCCSLVALVVIVPLGYCAYMLFGPDAGQAQRFGLRVDPDGGGPVTDVQRDQAIAVLVARLSAIGVDSPLVEGSSVPGENVEVLVPPLRDPSHVRMLLQAEADLELRPVIGEAPAGGYPTPDAALKAADGAPDIEALPYLERDDELAHGGRDAGQAPQPTGYLPVSKVVVIRGQDLRSAAAVPDEFKGSNYQINFTLKPAAAQTFGDWTGKNVGKLLAIVLNGRIRSAPRIQSQITDRGQITGRFSRQQAEDLALTLSSGELPGRTTVVSEAMTQSNHWRTKYGVFGVCFAMPLLVAGAVALAVGWPMLRRRA